MTRFDPGSKNRLTHHDLDRFPDPTLRDRLGRAVCDAGCLPRKEFFEAWEMARRVRRRIKGRRIVDVAGGHGLLGQILWVLDHSSPGVMIVDPAVPPSAATLHAALVHEWPTLAERVQFVTADLAAVPLSPDDLVVSCHACGALTDVVLASATAARCAVAVMPCCHDATTSPTGGLTGWMDDALAIDVIRAVRLSDAGHHTWTQEIPASITPKARLLVALPSEFLAADDPDV